MCYLFEKISEKFRYQKVQGNFIYTQRQSKSALQKNDSIWLQKHTNKGLKRRGFKTDLWLITWHVCLYVTQFHYCRQFIHVRCQSTIFIDKNTSKDKFMYLKAITIGPFGIVFSARPEGYTEYTEASISQITFLSRMLMKRNLWRGAIPTPAWLGLSESLCSRASKRWKPL